MNSETVCLLSHPDAIYIVKTVISADDSPLMLVGPNGPASAVGLEKTNGHSYVECGGPTLAGAKPNRMSTIGEAGPDAFAAQLPNDGQTLYGDDAKYRLRILTTGGFSPNGINSVLPTDFQSFFRLHALDDETTVLLTETGTPYELSEGILEIVGLGTRFARCRCRGKSS